MVRVRVAAIIVPFVVALGIAAVASIGCNDVETRAAPDAALPLCDQGPHAFPGALSPDQSATPGCSANDNTNLPVIALLPSGSRYGVKTKVNYVGTRDEQGDCNLQTVCTCDLPTAGEPVPEPIPSDAGADGDAAVAPAPEPSPTTPGTPKWTCQ